MEKVIIIIIATPIHYDDGDDDDNTAGENLYSIKWYKDQQEFYRSSYIMSHDDVDENNNISEHND